MQNRGATKVTLSGSPCPSLHPWAWLLDPEEGGLSLRVWWRDVWLEASRGCGPARAGSLCSMGPLHTQVWD